MLFQELGYSPTRVSVVDGRCVPTYLVWGEACPLIRNMCKSIRLGVKRRVITNGARELIQIMLGACLPLGGGRGVLTLLQPSA